MDLFCDDMIEVLKNSNKYQAAMFGSFFSIGAPTSIHLGVVSEIRGDSHPFRSSRVYEVIMLCYSCSNPAALSSALLISLMLHLKCPIWDHYKLPRSEATSLFLALGYQITIISVEFPDPCGNVWAMRPGEELKPVEPNSVPYNWVFVCYTVRGQSLLL